MLAGLEVVHFLIGFIDQVVHGGDVRLKAGAADADLDLIGLAGGGVGGVQLKAILFLCSVTFLKARAFVSCPLSMVQKH